MESCISRMAGDVLVEEQPKGRRWGADSSEQETSWRS